MDPLNIDPMNSGPTKPTPGIHVAADGHTYHKSSSANATVAPTSGATTGADEQAKKQLAKLTTDELDFVTLLDMHWGTTGTLLSKEIARDKYDVSVQDYLKYISSPKVKAAAVERGINFRDHDITEPELKWTHHTLSPKQLIVANTMLDILDTRNDRKKLQDLGIDSKVYQAWLRDPNFSGYLRERAEALLGASHHEAYLAMVDKVRSGDQRMIEYYHEFTGRFSRRPNSDGTIGAFDHASAAMLIQNIIEIIVEEVQDAETGQRISNRLQTLMTARATTNALMRNETITQPEVMPGREITPAIEALMNTGVGME